MSLFQRICEAKLKQPPQDIIKKVEQAASVAAGKTLKVVTSKESHKGWDFTFKGGGNFKIRTKGESFTVKLQGTPKPYYRFRGDGPTLDQALAALKPEKKPGIKKTVMPAKKAGKKQLPWKKGEPGPKEANINGLRFYNDIGADQATFDRYATAAKDSVDLLKRRGFGFMVKNVTMHLRVGKPGIAGNYDMHTKQVEIFVNIIGAGAEPTRIMFTMVHELGHHYYYREISRAKRKMYRWFFDQAYGGKAPMTAQGGKRVPKAAAAKAHKAGAFPTLYGATVRYEDFAEIFAAYIGKGHQLSTKYKLTRDIMNRFKSFLADDKRIDLRDDINIDQGHVLQEDDPCAGRATNKPWRTPGENKKFAVCVKHDGATKIVRFGDPSMEIKRDDPERRKNFRARHNCDDPGPKTKPRYWSCQGTWHPTKTVGQAVSEGRSSLFSRVVTETYRNPDVYGAAKPGPGIQPMPTTLKGRKVKWDHGLAVADKTPVTITADLRTMYGLEYAGDANMVVLIKADGDDYRVLLKDQTSALKRLLPRFIGPGVNVTRHTSPAGGWLFHDSWEKIFKRWTAYQARLAKKGGK